MVITVDYGCVQATRNEVRDTAGSNETKIASMVIGRTDLAKAVCNPGHVSGIMVPSEIWDDVDNDVDQRVPDQLLAAAPLQTIDESVEIQPESDAAKRQKMDDKTNHTYCLPLSSGAENMEIQPESDGGKHENAPIDSGVETVHEIPNDSMEIRPEGSGGKHMISVGDSASVQPSTADEVFDTSFDELASYVEHELTATGGQEVEYCLNDDKSLAGDSCEKKPAETDKDSDGTLANISGNVMLDHSGEKSEEQSLKESCVKMIDEDTKTASTKGRGVEQCQKTEADMQLEQCKEKSAGDVQAANTKDKDIEMAQHGETSEGVVEHMTSEDGQMMTSAVKIETAENASKTLSSLDQDHIGETYPLNLTNANEDEANSSETQPQDIDAKEDENRPDESTDTVADGHSNVVTQSASELTGREDDVSPDHSPELTRSGVDMSSNPTESPELLVGNKDETSFDELASYDSVLIGRKDEMLEEAIGSVPATEADYDEEKAVAEVEAGSQASHSAESKTKSTLTSGISQPSANPAVDAGQPENETNDVKENTSGSTKQVEHEL